MSVKGQLTTADYMTYEQFNYLCDCLRKDKQYMWELYCRVSFCTANRISDVLKLRRKDILGKNKVVRLEQKTQKGRQVKFNKTVQDKFIELYELLGKPDTEQYLIFNPKRKKAYHQNTVNLKQTEFKYKYKVKIENFTSHTFRKTFGRWVYESNNRSGEALILLNSIFRHSNLETTKIFIGLQQDDINKVFESIVF